MHLLTGTGKRGQCRSRRACAAAALALFAGLALAAPAGAAIVHVATWGSFGSGAGQLNHPAQVAVGLGGNVYVAEDENHRISEFTPGGSFIRKWGHLGGDGTIGTGAGEFSNPDGVAAAPSGTIYTAEFGGHRIQKFHADGTFQLMWGWGVDDGGTAFQTCDNSTPPCLAGLSGSGDRQFSFPKQLTTDGAGNVYVVDQGNDRIQVFDSNGNFVRKFGSSGTIEGKFGLADGVATDAAGNTYVSDVSQNRIQKFDSSGNFVVMWGWGVRTGAAQLETCTSACFTGLQGNGLGQLKGPSGVATDAAGNVYVAEAGGNRIDKYTSSGAFIARIGKNGGDGSSGTGDGEFNFPEGVALDPQGNIYVAEDSGNRIQKFAQVPPETTITGGPASPTRKRRPLLTFAADESGSSFECKLDTGAFASCTSPFQPATKLAQGKHTFQVRATDLQGIVDPTAASVTFKVDFKPPETTIVSGPSGTTHNRRPRFGFRSSQANSTFRCSMDGGRFAACDSPYQSGRLDLGSHTFRVKARDKAGNTDLSPASRGFRVLP